MINRIIEACGRNRFMVFLGVFFFSAWGIWATARIPLDAIPDLSDVQVIVFTDWPGRSPTLIEDQITYPIVTAMTAAPKVKYARGQSFLGLSFVNVVFEDGTDMYWARSRVMEYMQGVTGKLPEGVTPTLGPDATGVGWVFEYALVDESGEHDLWELTSFQDWTLRYWLQSVPGVAEVATIGGMVKQYQILLDPNKLLAYKIPLKTVIQAIRESNNDVGGRVLELSEREYMLRGLGYIETLDDLRDISLDLRDDGTPVFLGDVARVQIGPEMRRGLADLDGEGEVVGGVVIMRFGENALNVIKGVKAKLKEIEGSLPKGVKIVTTYDRSDLIYGAIDTLKEKLVEITLVVSVICLLFLFHFRSALVAILTLPVAILISFIAMYYLGLSSNVMSLGGIAIAVGAMVDAAIVMIENAHSRLEENPEADRVTVIIDAAKELGRPLFFSLIIITVSFMPVFTLESQEGRLFKPLAYTKTFAMFFAAIVSITLVPALMTLLIRGKITPAKKNPANRLLVFFYRPFLKGVLRFRIVTLIAALVVLAVTVPVFKELGSEFMPPLNEGTILYMPTTLPGLSIREAKAILQKQNKMLKAFPEVEHVFGKIGRAKTSTDPAPLNMVETVITFKPRDQWREGLTWDALIDEMDAKLQFPGMPNIWWMPIQTRNEMLATGIRSTLGIKILGPDLAQIERIAIEMEGLLKQHSGARSIFAERVTGGYYIDFKIKRREAARYGLRVKDLNDVIESAIGGKNIAQTVEGRERYPINVRYARELRDSPESLGRILIATKTGAHIPLAQVADIRIKQGPPMVRDENGSLAGFVFVDGVSGDLGTFVENAKKIVQENLKLPPGYSLVWAGQYQYMLRAKEKLAVVVPMTLLIIFVVLYINFKSIARSMIVLFSVPFALIGGIWVLKYLDYNMSVAVWVGLIALAGVASEMGVVMVTFLDEALASKKEKLTKETLLSTIAEGAAKRVRPVMMTAATTFIGLLPILWSTGTGADVMKRIAAPMVGGMISATVLTLFLIPVIYALFRGWELRRGVKGV
ncbi:Cobalt-zinc-cadmium resistance protein CzcA; Cation efflux system protein CusA [hydrothermal vent metagenome]|uniref:Cobalt-zinc-cadmium resistance protein CzcA Cation efflux system protein CusA n=1 Tax=hydrothermal vent metagenome TaxID=652676 RepID=A0A3B1CM03_9ZZZZ